MIITRCKPVDYPAIKHLLGMYDKKLDITKAHLNKRDIALQARLSTGEIIGFVWCGLMANKTICYVDKAVVHPGYHHQGVLNKLYKELFKIAYSMGAKEVFAIIKQDKYHDASAVNCLRMAVGADTESYTYVLSTLDKMKSELGLEK